jgi:tripartite-type tricarboxylate transporter receptor subunit TctC
VSAEDVRDRLLSGGAELVGSSPEKFSVIIKSDMAKWGKLIKDTGIRAE